MLGFLPFLFIVVASLALAIGTRDREQRAGLLETTLIACLLSGAWLTVGTELLSLGHKLQFGWILAWWAAPTAALTVFVFGQRRRLPAWVSMPSEITPPTRWLVLLCLSVVAAAGLVAVLSPVNNWDSLTYHLPRQIHWIQQRSVAYFPARNMRQDILPPFAEFAGAHLMILSGGDRWANLVQWFALPMSIVAVWLIARDLGGSPNAPALGGVLLATNPGVYMWATNAKNDLVLAAWLSILAWLVVRTHLDGSCGRGRAALIGIALGLSFLTKSTAVFFAAPLCVLVGVVLLLQHGLSCWRQAAWIGMAALLLNAGYFARNERWFGSLTGPVSLEEGGYAVFNQTHEPAAFVSGVARNVAMLLGTPSPVVNRALTSAVVELHRLIGFPLNDSRTTLRPDMDFSVGGTLYGGEDVMTAPLHMLVALLVPIVAAVKWRGSGARLGWVYLTVPYLGFVGIAGSLTWSIWNARYYIPFWCLWAPTAAVVLAATFREKLLTVLAMVAGLALVPTVLWNPIRPLLGPDSVITADPLEAMLRYRPSLIQPSLDVAALARWLGPARVGFALAGDDLEYHLQKMLLDAVKPPPTFSSFNGLIPKGLLKDEPVPDLAVVVEDLSAEIVHAASGTVFVPVAEFPPYRIYVPEATRAAAKFKEEIAAAHRDAAHDFDGDGKADFITFDPDKGLWCIRGSSAGELCLHHGTAEYQPLLGDFDGDGKTDLALFHVATGLWFIRNSSDGKVVQIPHGGPGSVPAPADYDGDGKTDVAVFYPAEGLWYIRRSSDGRVVQIAHGGPGSVPVPADYDGDGKADVAVFYPAEGLWFIRRSSDGRVTREAFGGRDYVPLRGDFDGDGKGDLAVVDPTGRYSFIRGSASGVTSTFDVPRNVGCMPVPADYDGDGRTDLAFYCRENGIWWMRSSRSGVTSTRRFGGAHFMAVH
ncbi:MAG TPA: FG-GAP-like repeat-containing protein [Vicinamibacteria bacterium]|nr:FG-GAP-like repeat-containing protein [Vicinamibacteria bacterium]